VVILALAVFSAVWWSNQPQGNGFNGFLADMVWTAFNGALALVGGIMLYARRPPGYEIGLAMFALLFLGQALHLVFPLPVGDFPGVVRLVQLAAFPLLLTLPYRQLTLVMGPQAASARRAAGIDPEAYQAFLDLATHSEPQEIYQAITRTVAHALDADLCLLISLSDPQNVITVYSGYDLSRRESLGFATFDSTLVPVLSEALRQSRPLHLPADSKLPDLNGLSKMFDLKLAGSVLAAPIASPGDTPAMALLLLSPYTRRVWSAADQNYLADIARALVEVLRRSQSRLALEDSLDQASRALQSLQSENERLSVAVDDLSAQKALFPEIQELQEQLRLALEEIATLQNALMVSDLRVTAADSSELPQPEPQPETQT
jgi:GAF domain-containing protein